jgi:isopenicillin-N epimerase
MKPDDIASATSKVITINNHLRSQFLLDPDVVFLNHGTFGACPRPVFEDYQRWQLELERRPIEFLGRRSDGLLDEARARLGQYLNTKADNLIFVVNATTGINAVARSLSLQPGDEILTTDHEYGAIDKTWDFICRKTGARIVRHEVTLPLASAQAFVDSFWQAVTPRTRIISISHITSPTALIFPVAEICHRAREAGILTVVDGAHAPGQIPVDLTALEADFYSGNCHKWLCAPKGAGFLYARPEHHALVEPLVISHGWTDDSTLVSRNQWQGTRDIAAFLSVPAAIEFQAAHDWDQVRRACHTLASNTLRRIADITALPSLSADSPVWFAQMVSVPIPDCDVEELKRTLYDEYCIEVPVIAWNGRSMVRISLQGYNTPDDADCLVQALGNLLSLA